MLPLLRTLNNLVLLCYKCFVVPTHSTRRRHYETKHVSPATQMQTSPSFRLEAFFAESYLPCFSRNLVWILLILFAEPVSASPSLRLTRRSLDRHYHDSPRYKVSLTA